MSIINCAECRHRVSDKASACPSCGAQIKKRGAARTALAVFSALGFGLAATLVAGTVSIVAGLQNPAIPMALAFAVGVLAGWLRVMR